MCSEQPDGLCSQCYQRVNYQRSVVRQSANRKITPAKLKYPSPSSLTSPKLLKLTIQAQHLKCRQLQSEIGEMATEIQKNSVNNENDLSHDLLTIICYHGDKMTPFRKLFWQ